MIKNKYGGYVKLIVGGRCCLMTRSEIARGIKRFHSYRNKNKRKK